MNAIATQPYSNPAAQPHLAGQVAVVVGSGGDSSAAAAALASAGAAVTLAAPDESRLMRTARAIRSAGGLALAIPTDIADPRALDRAMKATHEAFGRLDVAINSPQSVRRRGRVGDSACRTIYLAMRYQLPLLRRSGGGVVVNSALSRLDDADCVIGLTRAAALDQADGEVRINSIAYGPGTPEDFAAAVLWLCSDLSLNVNGAAVPVGLRPQV